MDEISRLNHIDLPSLIKRSLFLINIAKVYLNDFPNDQCDSMVDIVEKALGYPIIGFDYIREGKTKPHVANQIPGTNLKLCLTMKQFGDYPDVYIFESDPNLIESEIVKKAHKLHFNSPLYYQNINDCVNAYNKNVNSTLL